MNRQLHDAWWRLTSRPSRRLCDRLSLRILDAVSALYGAGVAVRNTAYDRGWAPTVHLNRPVISIGNLSMGGTGKTVCVEYVARHLLGLGRRVSIVSRGYRGRAGGAPYMLCVRDHRLLRDGASVEADALPDEPQLLAWHLPDVPVVVGRRRDVSGALAIERGHADVLVLDDGLQHRRLARSLEIVLVSAQMPLDGWPLFPRGPMREPLSSLRRADMIILTKADQSLDCVSAMMERLHARYPNAVLAAASHEPCPLREALSASPVPAARVAGAAVALVSAIGDPDGFEHTVRVLGVSIMSHTAFPDHHRYDAGQWREVTRAASAAGAAAIVTTEKDLMRLRPLLAASASALPTWVLPVRFRLLRGEEDVHARLAAVCAG